jgi:large subunit ribosomal protein L15
MKLSNLQKNNPNKPEVRIGRGGKRGKTSGRGTKGQFAHGGHGVRTQIRDEIRRLPKLRGRALHPNKSINPDSITINLSRLDQLCEKGAVVTFAWLKNMKLVPKMWKGSDTVKILGFGEMTKAITVQGIPVSTSATEKITQKGGSVVQ